ncbi:Crp/Fnr family transcriptional regulator [Cytophagaceae bacterium AH-315-L13]|nr:Crp/Fnr family transcriptional regulator [Cytophagaceae bacterium AH-315-L13]
MTKKMKLWHLKNFNFFDCLSDEELKYVADHTTDQKIEKEQYVFLPQNKSSIAYFLKEGKVQLGSFTKGERKIFKSVIQSGEVFGLLGLFLDETRDDFAQALTKDVTVCYMNMEDLQFLMRKNKDLKSKITEHIILRFGHIERRMESLVYKNSRARIIDFLKELAEQSEEMAGTEIYINNYLTHQEFANLTWTSRQTVTAVLNDLRNKNLIYFDRKRILIRDVDELK